LGGLTIVGPTGLFLLLDATEVDADDLSLFCVDCDLDEEPAPCEVEGLGIVDDNDAEPTVVCELVVELVVLKVKGIFEDSGHV
jgi:hypothetical protein